MMQGADRLHTVEEYYFSRKMRELRLMMASGKPVINLGIGSPDLPPPQRVVSALVSSLDEPHAHKYQSYQGLPELRQAMTAFYREHYQVHLSPKNEVLPLIGSKEGIMHISMAYLNPGDEVLVPNPGYPTYSAVAKLIGAKPVYYDLNAEGHWLPDIMALQQSDLSRVKLMWINYPHMPTGAHADYKFFNELTAFAKRHDILLVNDNPYSFILNENPKSLLKANQSKGVCLELNSLSKTFNMAGWRIGMLVGHEKHIANVLKVKSNMDSGMFYGLQMGGIEALKCSKLWYTSLNSVYEKRRKLIWSLADKLNCTYDSNASGLFVWAKLPEYFKSEEFVDILLKNHHLFIAPGSIFGSNGEGYIRFSVCAPDEQIEEAIARIK
ncbi:MAG: aminotransferase class I/II-fold pyridoxal phosphate-dependent enzyme [Flavobacteriaceae bacterium]|nr:aminotransferase class I/II-fold pyridoxal phosphate-dependent enzyme [Bacteroidia bacterium]MBT8287822.1 aminotransferase class I/II-fold pyridoxal phosphate-dependent enzyme [Bacteroidia bacterium]NNF76159.1 aminotransferase class I/II-fold pyridoxal phosphate-dependent enzyme [Flavobacteriaceae bacterium]NNK73772.1 aminotransferase class I/II-fold pyridoxal phosphate-dependent enzyme [Flavobacteriaceae bacterium]